MGPRLLLAAALAVIPAGCAHAQGPGTKGFNPPMPDTHAQADARPATDFAEGALAPAGAAPGQVGLATWYGSSFAGKKTANGERFDPRAMTAAHRTLKMGTWVEVRRPDTGRTVRVRINDRGPFGDSRKVIDLSRRAAEELEMIQQGAMHVEIRIVGGPE